MSASIAYRRRDGNASDAIAAILNPDEGYREKLVKRGVVPKNYELANRRKLKKQQEEMREKRRQAEVAAPAAFKLTKFKAVEPRVYGDKGVDTTPLPPKKHEFLRRGASSAALRKKHEGGDSTVPSALLAPASARATSGSMRPSAKDVERPRRQPVKAPIPTRQELEELTNKLAELHHKEQVDYVNTNAWEVIKQSPSKPVDDTNSSHVHHHFGRIPTYLLHRKDKWAREEDERRRNLPDPDCPRGMMPMEEAERVRTLSVLQQSLREARLQLNGLPLRIETLSQVRRKNELEAKFQEIEDAIAVFRKPKVYVAKPMEVANTELKRLKGSNSGRNSRTSAVAA